MVSHRLSKYLPSDDACALYQTETDVLDWENCTILDLSPRNTYIKEGVSTLIPKISCVW